MKKVKNTCFFMLFIQTNITVSQNNTDINKILSKCVIVQQM